MSDEIDIEAEIDALNRLRGNCSIIHGVTNKPIQEEFRKFILKAAYEKVLLNEITFSTENRHRSSTIILSDNLKTATSSGGYNSVRASISFMCGCYYWEIIVLNYPYEDSAVRLGMSTILSEIDGSVGKDQYSYGYISKTGYKVHNRIPEKYGLHYKVNDIIGIYVNLNELNSEDSYIEFFLNGISQGIAYNHIPISRYYPTVSMFHGSKVKINGGPFFQYPPNKPHNSLLSILDKSKMFLKKYLSVECQ